MFGPPGHAYVYLVYGVHNCLNVVAGPDGTASAVLIRAVEPVTGIDVMHVAAEAVRHHGRSTSADATVAVRGRSVDDRVASGPGRIGAAFGIDRSLNGMDLCSADASLRLAPADGPSPAVVLRTPRIGVGYAGEPWSTVAWRFIVAGSPSLSGPRHGNRPVTAP